MSDKQPDYEEIPIRLPSGTKAIVRLPNPFTREDATHLILFLAQYVEESIGSTPATPDAKGVAQLDKQEKHQ